MSFFLTGLDTKWYIYSWKTQQFIRWHRRKGHEIILNYMPWHDRISYDTHDMTYDRTGHGMNLRCLCSDGMSLALSWQYSCLLSSLAWPRSSSIMSTSSPPEFQSLGETIHRFLCAIGSQDTRKINKTLFLFYKNSLLKELNMQWQREKYEFLTIILQRRQENSAKISP